MTGKKLLEAMNQIDDAYVEEYAGLTAKIAAVFRGFRRYQKVLAASIALVILLSFAVTVTVCSHPTEDTSHENSSADNMIAIIPLDYAKYCRYLKIKNPEPSQPRLYVVDAFGTFSSFWLERGTNVFEVTDPNGMTLRIYAQPMHYSTPSYSKLETLPGEMTSMRHLGRSYSTPVYYEKDGVGYYYSEDGCLKHIQFAQNSKRFSVYFAGKKWIDYPQDGEEDILIEQLLSGSPTTVSDGISQLKASVDRGWALTRLEHWCFSVLPGVAVLLGFLLVAAPVTINGIINVHYRKKHGSQRQPSKKRFLLLLLLTMLCIVLAMMIFDEYTLLPNLNSVVTEYLYEPIRLVPASYLQTVQLREGMPYSETLALLGSPQAKDVHGPAQWDLLFGGTLTAEYEDGCLVSWTYSAFTSANGWILPGALLLMGLLGLCFYRCCFCLAKNGKKFCLACLGAVLVLTYAGSLLVNLFILPQYDQYNKNTVYSCRIMYPNTFAVGQITEEMSIKQIGEILGQPNRYRYFKGYDCEYEWDMPFGAVFRVRYESQEQGNGSNKLCITEKGIRPFASVWGFVVPGVMLITFLTELGIYGYLFYGDALGTLLGKRQKSKKTDGPAKE